MKGKLILSLVMLLCMIGLASALDFDNVKNFNPNKPIKGEIVIENNFGLGSKLAEYTLTDHSDQCLIDCYSEGTAVFYSNDKLFRDVKFYNKYNTRKNPNYQILIKEDVLYTWTEKTYQTQCSVVTNGTGSGNVCNQVENGTISKSETRKEWRPYDGRILSSGSYEWRIEAKKGSYESIDWVGESFGVELNEWAWWNSSWSRSKQLSNLTGSITQIWIPKAAEMNTTGTDLRFTNLANTTEINFTFVPINSTGHYWNSSGFMVRLYNDGVDKVLMYYGNSFSSSGSNASKVYGNSFISYWAFEEASGTTVYDLFGKANGTIGSTTGRLFGNFSQAINFTGTGSNVSWLSDHYARNHLNVSGKFGQFILGKLYANSYYGFQQDCGTAADAACLAIQSNLYDSNPSRPVIYQAGNGNAYSGSDNGFVLNSWLTMTIWGGSATAQYSINGVNKTLADYNGNDKNANSHPMYFGARVNGGATSKATTDEFGVYTAMLSLKEISNLANQTYSTAVYGNEMFENTLLVTNNYPENGNSFTRSNIHFNATATDDTAVLNITLFIDNVANQTFYNTSALQTTLSFNVTKYVADGAHTWRAEAYDNSGATYASTNYSFTVDTSEPGISISSPTNNGYIYSKNSTYASFPLTATATDTSPISATWYNSTWSGTKVYFENGNTTYINTTNVFGNQTIYVFANDTIGNMHYETVNITIHKAIWTNNSYETDSSTFVLELYNLSTVPTSTIFNYNGENYTLVAETLSDGRYSLNYTIDTATSPTNVPFFWYFTDTTARTSDTYYQTVSPIYFVLCNSTLNVPYINLTFKDEDTNLAMNASITSSTWTYFLGTGSVNKSLTYTNSGENQTYSFCFSPGSETLNLDYSVQFASTGYPSRIYNPALSQFSNTTTVQTLYLLSTSNGIYSTIQAAQVTNQVISGVSIVWEVLLNNEYVTVSTGTTDSAGLFTSWVSPTSTYRVTASKSGYATQQLSIQPSQTIYTIIMLESGGSSASYNGSTLGMLWSTTPKSGFLNSNGGQVNFTFNLTASLGNLESCKFELYNLANQTILASATGGTAYGCNLSTSYTFSTSEEYDLVGRLYIDTTDTDGYYLLDADIRWREFETNVSSSTIFTSFIDDLMTFPEFGEGYRGEFSRIIFFFFFLTLFMALLSYFTQIDLTNPGLILIILTLIIIPFSVVGWFTIDFGSPNADSWLEQYWLALTLSLITIGYMLNQWGRY